ncbi:MAG: ABC transporter permease [Ferrovibrionaceae bacterium]
MIRALGYRALQAAAVALMVGVLTFVLMRSLPGDMAWRIAAGRYGYDITDATVMERVRQELALDQSAAAALLSWLNDLLRLDLGASLVSGLPVAQEILHQLGASLNLALAALVMSLVIGPPLGILAGLRPGGRLDHLLLFLSVSLRALPQFVIGLLLIYGLAIVLGLLPSAGHGDGSHVVLPALTLAFGLAAVSCRVARDATVAVTESGYYRFGETKGLRPAENFFRHGLRNIAVPIITYLGVQLIYLIEGVVVVETLFAWPGIGHALVHAILARDIPMIQGTALVMGLMFVMLNAVVDLACGLIDPRRRGA